VRRWVRRRDQAGLALVASAAVRMRESGHVIEGPSSGVEMGGGWRAEDARGESKSREEAGRRKEMQ
jgi:hypothetical protein